MDLKYVKLGTKSFKKSMEFLKIYKNVRFLVLFVVQIGKIEPTYVKPLFEYRLKAIEDNSDRAYDVECEVHSSKYI